jgi:hypothetical protein
MIALHGRLDQAGRITRSTLETILTEADSDRFNAAAEGRVSP